MDWTGISTELAKDLDRKHVKPPAPGKYGEYMEGWVVIKEANRIFGHGGWSYRLDHLTVTNSDLVDKTDDRGNAFKQWQVGYLATVTVTVGDVSRQDVGHGQGHSRSAGDAHDSAAKEAVTDALKRALRTFGYPLGLALYDKSKGHVSDNPNAADEYEERVANAISMIESTIDGGALADFWRDLDNRICADQRVIKAKDKRKAELAPQKETA